MKRLAVAVMSLMAGVVAAAAQGMSLPGKFAVSASGSATYSIPISGPPGTAGTGPSLSLSYNSQYGNGLVGMGWSLGGLPSIGRCPQTMEQDGVRGAVRYDGSDRFCLDGERLIAVSGAYGADGTEYRTEIEGFSRVISHGAAGNGPSWFEVRTKTGQVMEFGNTSDSRVLAQGKPTARLWLVNRVSDTKGNYFDASYVNDTVTGQAYPNRIDYTGNAAAGLSPYNSVRFVYTSRTDSQPTYHAGSLVQSTTLLSAIRTYAGENLVAVYGLTYQQSATTGRNQLTAVTLCDGGNVCLPATTFTWQSGSPTPTAVSNVAGQNGALSGHRPYIGDFNGDGLMDVLWDAEQEDPATSTGSRTLWTNTGGNFSASGNFGGQDGTLQGHVPLVADFNRDGRTDIWWYQADSSGSASATTRWINQGSGTFAVSAGPALPYTTSYWALNYQPGLVPDFNGDGRADIGWHRHENVLTQASPPEYAWYAFLQLWRVNADLSVSTTEVRAPIPSDPLVIGPRLPDFRAADFDGDGVSDVLWSRRTASPGTSGVAALWFGNGDGTFRQISGEDTSVNGYLPHIGDFNGDGKADILWDSVDSDGRSTGQRILWFSKGDGTFSVIANPGGMNGTEAGAVPNLGDFNGDGLTDILWNHVDSNGLSSGVRTLWRNLGNGGFAAVPNFAGMNGSLVGYVPILSDFNGDGKTDVLWDSRSGSDTRSAGTRLLWLSDGIASDVITAISNGIGSTTSVTYLPLTKSAVYTKYSDAVDPVIDIQTALFVVSRVDRSNGIGGLHGTAYTYAGAKAHNDGRGFLGFRLMTVTDLQTNVVQTTVFRQFYPYQTLVVREITTLNGATLNSVYNIYGSTALGGTRYQVFVAQTQVSGNDLDGTVLPGTTTTYQYDAYGNATQVTAATTDGHSKTTTNTYTNDTANWILGRLTRATVTSQSPQPQSGPPQCTLPWGGTVAAGQSVTAYSAVNPPLGQSCSSIAQTRTCRHGELTGSYTSQTCARLCALPWGGSIASGQSVTAYSATNAPAGQTCAAYAQTRTCSDGTLSGSFGNQVCYPPCNLPWGGQISNGESVTAYAASTAPLGQRCQWIVETRTCTNGSLSGSYAYQTCVRTPVTPGSQTFSSPGTYTFSVPSYNTLTVTVAGAGGGGGYAAMGWASGHGWDGGTSRFAAATPVDGNGGHGWNDPQGSYGPNHGGASGGDTNTPGGGAAGGWGLGLYDNGGIGGTGGRAQKSWGVWTTGAPTPGSTVAVTVGAGGSQASGGNSGSGSPGSVSISWN